MNTKVFTQLKQVPLKLSVQQSEEHSEASGNVVWIIKVPADARTSYGGLYRMLTNPTFISSHWPKGVCEESVEIATTALIGDESLATKPFRNLSPRNSPRNGYVVRPHPTIDHMWFVITPLVDIASSWPNSDEAYCAVWDLAVANGDAKPLPQTYAYIGVEIPEPEGYHITFHHPGHDLHPDVGHQPAWYFETDDEGSEDFASEVEALIAAWQHKFASEQQSTPSIPEPLQAEHHKQDMLIINVPTWFKEPQFVEFLNSGDAMTLHSRGQPADEFSDVLVFVEPNLMGDGDVPGIMPDRYWNQIIETCRLHCSVPASNESRPRIMVRLTNLEE